MTEQSDLQAKDYKTQRGPGLLVPLGFIALAVAMVLALGTLRNDADVILKAQENACEQVNRLRVITIERIERAAELRESLDPELFNITQREFDRLLAERRVQDEVSIAKLEPLNC